MDLFENSSEGVGAWQVEYDIFVASVSYVEIAQLHVTERDVTQSERLDDQRPVGGRNHLV